jgi:hypothetical protein
MTSVTSSSLKRSSTVLSAGARQLTWATNRLSASVMVKGAWPPVPSGPWQFSHCEPSVYVRSPRLTNLASKPSTAPDCRLGSLSQ